MAVIQDSTVVHCAPDQAFDYLSDHRADLEWVPYCKRKEKLTGGPVGLGTRFRGQWQGSPVRDLEIVEFDRPRSWTVHNAGPIEGAVTTTVEPDIEGARLHVDFHLQRHPPPDFSASSPHAAEARGANMHKLRAAFKRRASQTEEGV